MEKDYFLGDYQECIKKARSLPPGKEPTFYICLSYYHLRKYDVLRHEIKQSDEQCIALIGRFLQITEEPSSKDEVLASLADPKDDLSKFITSVIYTHLKLYQDALRTLHQQDSLPAALAKIAIYIQMDRIDLAESALKAMKEKHDYSAFTLLASAQVCLASGNAKEAFDNARELEELYKPTPFIKTIQAVAKISLGDYHHAKDHCKISLDMDSENPDTLINMIHITSRLGPYDARERYYDRLKALYPDHEYIRDIESIRLQ